MGIDTTSSPPSSPSPPKKRSLLSRILSNLKLRSPPPPSPPTPTTPTITGENEWADLKRWGMIVIATVLAGMNLALFYENIGGKPKSN